MCKHSCESETYLRNNRSSLFCSFCYPYRLAKCVINSGCLLKEVLFADVSEPLWLIYLRKTTIVVDPAKVPTMALDRGRAAIEPAYQTISTLNNPVIDDELNDLRVHDRRREELNFLSEHGHEPQNFTLRGILVGLAVGLIICFSNMYFGLQSRYI